MKRFNLLLLLLGVVITVLPAGAQRSAIVRVHDNGLMYSDSAMTALRLIVERKNAEFRSRPPGPRMKSMRQAPCHYLEFRCTERTGDSVRKALRKGLPPDRVRAQYGRLLKVNDSAATVVQLRKKAAENKSLYTVGNGDHGYEGSFGERSLPVLRRWAVRIGGIVSPDKPVTINAVWMVAPFGKTELHADLARCVRYVDHLIDTATPVLQEHAREDLNAPDEMRPILDQLYQINYSFTYGSLCYRGEIHDSLVAYVRSELLQDTAFVRRVRSIADTMIERGVPSVGMENLLELIRSPKQQLALMRLRTVNGGCVVGPAERAHDHAIARVAAEAHDLSVLLRAHVSALSDGEVRVRDGQVVPYRPETYIRELEELGIDVVDLAVGLVVEYDEMPKGHCRTWPSRMGRAMAETRDSARFTERIVSYLRDPSIDAFNRDLLYMTYEFYLSETADPELRRQRYDAFIALAPTFPDDVRAMVLAMRRPE